MSVNFSGKMRTVSFISAMLVIWIHAYNIEVYNVQSTILYWGEEFLSQCVAHMAVPFFFMQSAFYLYDNTKSRKVRKVYKTRLKSLFIPYVVWNVLYMLAFMILNRLGLSNVGECINAKKIIKGIFLYEYNYSYWFIFYLMIFVLLYPFIRWIISRNIAVAISVLILMLVVYWNGQEFVGAFIYYYIGVIAGLYYKDKIESMVHMSKKKKLIICGFLLVIAIVLFIIVNIYGFKKLDIIRNMIMVALCFSLVDISNLHINHMFLGMSFMIYSMHPIVLEAIEKVIYILLPHNDFLASVDYIVAPIITFIIIYFAVLYLRKRLPWLYKCLNGQRK